MWTRHQQPQQRGAQLSARQRRWRDRPPTVATRDREAQDHEHAAGDAGGVPEAPGESPASLLENRGGEASPGGDPITWDAVVQPEPARTGTNKTESQRLPEGQ